MPSYKITLNKQDIIFNTIPANKIDNYYNILLSNSCFAEEYIFNEITNNKYNINEFTAGIIPTIIFTSFKLSGRIIKAEDLPNKIDKYREIIKNDIYFNLYTGILKYLPKYTLEELKLKSLNEILELFVLAECIKEDKMADTDGMRAIINSSDKKSTYKKKGISAISKEELTSLKAVLQSDEYDGMPIDYE